MCVFVGGGGGERRCLAFTLSLGGGTSLVIWQNFEYKTMLVPVSLPARYLAVPAPSSIASGATGAPITLTLGSAAFMMVERLMLA